MQYAAAKEPIGSAIAGRYRIEIELGHGGMGIVYGVLDERSGRRVALKRLHCDRPTHAAMVATLFEREYHTLKQLAHPCIVEAYEFGVDETGPYYTMELLPGTDLARLAPMPWHEACAVLRDVASALALVHARRLVHRDLSPRNVRCSDVGRAKLIDFGALASIGTCGELIGTPPLMAPETAQRQPVDGRADVYSLGALAYFLLTGRHAYPASRMSELSDLWQSWPPPISSFAPDVPRAIEALVFSMINLDPLARPASIAEVIERLMAVAELAPADGPSAARWHLLSTPTLIGREQELVQLRQQLASAVRGRGGVSIVEGPSGLGKSRMLQAFGLDARLLGATVIHVAPMSSARYATANALADALLQADPDLAIAAAQHDRPALASALPALRVHGGERDPADTGEPLVLPQEHRAELQRAVSDWLLRIARERPLVITVDDAERADDGTLWLLCAIALRAHESRMAIVLGVNSDVAAAREGALAIIRRHAAVLTLAPLDAEQGAALVRSVYGDVPNLKLVASWIGKLSDGRPRSFMELVEHLLERGVVRYERGSFVLPSSLSQGELPASLGEAIAAAIDDLPPLARELAHTLALAKAPLALPEYARGLGLPAQRSDALFSAIDALVSARVLVLERELYRFRHQGYADAAARAFAVEHSAAVHRRLAAVFEARGDVALQAGHRLEAGDDLDALAIVMPLLAQASGVLGLGDGPAIDALPIEQMPWLRDPRDVIRLLDLGIELCRKRGRPEQEVFKLRTALLTMAMISDVAKMRGHIAAQLQALARMTGAVHWDEFASAASPLERAQQCLARAQETHDATPESERLLAPSEAIGSLLIHAGQAQSYARQALDLPLIETLTELTGRFRALAPPLEIIDIAALHTLELVRGRHEHAARERARLLAYYAGMSAAAQPPHPIVFLGYALAIHQEGMYRCMHGGVDALSWARKLEDCKWWPWLGADRPPDPDAHHVFVRRAWDVRRLCHLWNGDAAEAQACLEPIERLSMQHAHAAYGGGGALLEAQAYAMSADLMGLKQCLETIARIVDQQYRGWEPCLHAARGHHLRLRGDLDAAVESFERAIACTGAGRHPAWALAASGLVEALHAAGDTERALACARQALGECERAAGGSTVERDLVRVLALAEASAVDPAAGAARLDQLIEREIASGTSGLALGCLYETRASIALLQDDSEAFERFAQLTAAQYRPGRNPALIAKYERLMDVARRRGLRLSAELPRAATNSLHSALTHTTIEAITRLDAPESGVEPANGDRRSDG
jgi:tetratricopeptide (TPR) repeat protein